MLCLFPMILALFSWSFKQSEVLSESKKYKEYYYLQILSLINFLSPLLLHLFHKALKVFGAFCLQHIWNPFSPAFWYIIEGGKIGIKFFPSLYELNKIWHVESFNLRTESFLHFRSFDKLFFVMENINKKIAIILLILNLHWRILVAWKINFSITAQEFP